MSRNKKEKSAWSEKITFIVGLHGNEHLPVLALDSAGIPHIVGNPKALAEGARWIDFDLNSAFNSQSDKYEARRAQLLLKKIPKKNMVVDFHTSNSANVPFAIVTDKKMIPFALTTGLKHIVHMKYNIKKGGALIDLRDGISIETGKHREAESFYTTLEVVKNVKKGKMFNANVYEVYGKITKPGRYINFRFHRDGFYPVLSGETSYDFLGLKAKKIDYER